MTNPDRPRHIEVGDDGQPVAAAEVTTSAGADGTVRASLHAQAGHITPGRRASLVDAVMDLPEVQASTRLEATIPLGDGESLERLRERTEDAVTRQAGSTTLLDANIPSGSQPGPGQDPDGGTTSWPPLMAIRQSGLPGPLHQNEPHQNEPWGDAAERPAAANALHRCARWSDWLDVLGLGALGALAGGELHPLVFLEAAVTVSLDDGVVNEDVTRPVIGGDETIALVGVEPLHCTLSHFYAFSYENDVRVYVRGPEAAATACIQKPDSWNPRRPLSELRRRCDTNTNFYCNH